MTKDEEQKKTKTNKILSLLRPPCKELTSQILYLSQNAVVLEIWSRRKSSVLAIEWSEIVSKYREALSAIVISCFLRLELRLTIAAIVEVCT